MTDKEGAAFEAKMFRRGKSLCGNDKMGSPMTAGMADIGIIGPSPSTPERKREIKLEAQSLEAEHRLLWPVLSAGKGQCRDKPKKETEDPQQQRHFQESNGDPESLEMLLTTPHPRIRVTSSFLPVQLHLV